MRERERERGGERERERPREREREVVREREREGERPLVGVPIVSGRGNVRVEPSDSGSVGELGGDDRCLHAPKRSADFSRPLESGPQPSPLQVARHQRSTGEIPLRQRSTKLL